MLDQKLAQAGAALACAFASYESSGVRFYPDNLECLAAFMEEKLGLRTARTIILAIAEDDRLDPEDAANALDLLTPGGVIRSYFDNNNA